MNHAKPKCAEYLLTAEKACPPRGSLGGECTAGRVGPLLHGLHAPYSGALSSLLSESRPSAPVGIVLAAGRLGFSGTPTRRNRAPSSLETLVANSYCHSLKSPSQGRCAQGWLLPIDLCVVRPRLAETKHNVGKCPGGAATARGSSQSSHGNGSQ